MTEFRFQKEHPTDKGKETREKSVAGTRVVIVEGVNHGC